MSFIIFKTFSPLILIKRTINIEKLEHVNNSLCAVKKSSSLGVSEVRGDRDHTIVYFDVEGDLSRLLELGEQGGRELLRAQLLALPGVVDVVGGSPGLRLGDLEGNPGQLGLDLGVIKLPEEKGKFDRGNTR